MRRVVAAVIIICMTFNVFTGCQMKTKETFTFENMISDSNVDYYLNPVSIETIVSSTPFYLGDYRLPGKGYENYQKLAEKKIEPV